MELIFEFIAELLFEAVTDASNNRKLKPWVRHTAKAVVFILYFFAAAILCLICFAVIKNNIPLGITLFVFTVCILVAIFARFKKKKLLLEFMTAIIMLSVGTMAEIFLFILLTDTQNADADPVLLLIPIFGLFFLFFGIKKTVSCIKALKNQNNLKSSTK